MEKIVKGSPIEGPFVFRSVGYPHACPPIAATGTHRTGTAENTAGVAVGTAAEISSTDAMARLIVPALVDQFAMISDNETAGPHKAESSLSQPPICPPDI